MISVDRTIYILCDTCILKSSADTNIKLRNLQDWYNYIILNLVIDIANALVTSGIFPLFVSFYFQFLYCRYQ